MGLSWPSSVHHQDGHGFGKRVCHIQFTPDFSLCAVGKDIINTREGMRIKGGLGLGMEG